MRPVIILLGVLTIVLGVVFIQQRQIDRDQLTAAQTQTQASHDAHRQTQELLTACKTQQEIATTQWKQQVTTLESGKATVEAQFQQTQQQAETLKQELATAHKAAQEQQGQLTILAREKAALVAESTRLAEQLRAAQQQLAAPALPAAAVAQSTPAADPRVGLELASLQARWTNQAAVKTQLRALQKQLRSERIAAWKRIDAEETAEGNRGILMHNGQWHPATPPAVNY